jgi:hypothetical protein
LLGFKFFKEFCRSIDPKKESLASSARFFLLLRRSVRSNMSLGIWNFLCNVLSIDVIFNLKTLFFWQFYLVEKMFLFGNCCSLVTFYASLFYLQSALYNDVFLRSIAILLFRRIKCNMISLYHNLNVKVWSPCSLSCSKLWNRS